MSVVDEETRQMILRKTWCHGQAILPLYSVVLIAWWWHIEGRPLRLLFASIVLPIWAWYSYRAVLTIDRDGQLPIIRIYGLGAMAMLAHALVFTVAIKAASADAWHMLMTISSGLFVVETGAFLLVAHALRREVTSSQNEPLNRNEML